MKPSTFEKLRLGFRLLLGFLLLWAAVSKLAKPVDFLGSLYAYELPFPRPFLKFVAVFLPWMELLCGLLLVANYMGETALFCAVGLFAVFILATGQAWARGLNISCGCFDLTIFGLDKSHPGLVTYLESASFAFLRNLALLSVALFLLRSRVAELKASTITMKQAARPQSSPRRV